MSPLTCTNTPEKCNRCSNKKNNKKWKKGRQEDRQTLSRKTGIQTDRNTDRETLTNGTDDAAESLAEGTRVNVQRTHVVDMRVRVRRLQLHGPHVRHLYAHTRT